MSVATNTNGNIPLYRFFVTYSATEYEVFPLNFLSTMLVDELESGQVFYRRKFSVSLLFGTNSKVIDELGAEQNRQDDWALFWAIEAAAPCTEIPFWIEKTVSGVMAVYWEGYFSTSDGKFDIDNCTFEVTPYPDDCYVDLLDKATLQHNILDIATEVTTTADWGTGSEVYTHNRWLTDVIDYLASDATVGIKPGCTLSYDFFTDTPNNYVTENANHLTLLTLAQKSDIRRPTSSTPATTAMLSWNELMDILWGMFQVMWDYDEATDTINVEHISWWTKALGMDLRGDPMTTATNKYSYIKAEMPKYEKWIYAEADDSNFVGVPIWYNSKCVNDDPASNVWETNVGITTDLEHIINNDDAIVDEGFVMLCNYEDGGNYYVEFEGGMLDATVRLNMHLSCANLLERYFRHNRVLISGYLNDTLTTFWTAQKTKQQDCSIIICPVDAYDPNDGIATELGQSYFGGALATVNRSELKPSGEIKFNLLYGPADNENTGVADIKCMRVIEVGNPAATESTFYFTFSHPADAALVADPPQYNLTCQESVTFTTCATGWQALVVNLGDRAASMVVDWCVPAGGPPDCVLIHGFDPGAWACYDEDFDVDTTC